MIIVCIPGAIASSIQTLKRTLINAAIDFSNNSYNLYSFSAPENEIPYYWFKFSSIEDFASNSFNLSSFSVTENQLSSIGWNYYFLSGSDLSTNTFRVTSFSVPQHQLSARGWGYHFLSGSDLNTNSYNFSSFSVSESELSARGWGYYFLSGSDLSTNSYNFSSFSVPQHQLSARNWGYYFLSGSDLSTNSYNFSSFEVPDSQLTLMYPISVTGINPTRASIYGVSVNAQQDLGMQSYERFSFSYWETTTDGINYSIVPNYQSTTSPYAFLSGGSSIHNASVNQLSARAILGYNGRSYRTNPIPLKPYSSILDIPNLQIWLDASDTTSLSAGTGVTKNSFIDSSSNNFTITKNGNPGQGTFSPFYPNGAVYNPTTHGGSCYFDRGGYVSTPSDAKFSFGTGNFTIEFWMYSFDTSGGTQLGMIQTSDVIGGLKTDYGSGIVIGQGQSVPYQPMNGGINANVAGVSIGSTTPKISTNKWHHVALVRQSGTATLYVDGLVVGSASAPGNCTGTYAAIGGYYNGNYLFNGYLSNFRIVKGTPVYTTNFAVPTAPLASTGASTSLLLNFTNGLALDGTARNNLVLNGDATVVNSVKKYGMGSYYFDGSGDFVLAPAKDDYNFGSGDFTIECWVRFINTTTSSDGIIDTGSTLNSANGNQWFIYRNGNILRFGRHAVADLLTYNTSSLSPYTWYHIAVTRDNGELSMFIDGVRVASTVYSGWVIDGSNVRIGAITTPYYMNGYIDDVRLTKGIARYGPETALLLNGNGTNDANNNVFKDSSSNDFTITRNGSVTQGSFSPFPLNGASYNPSVHGGSGYFDGSSILSLPAGNSAFDIGSTYTIESWVYVDDFNNGIIFGMAPIDVTFFKYILVRLRTNGRIRVECRSNTGQPDSSVTSVESTLPITSKQWNHVAFSVNAGVCKIYINGVESGSGSVNTYNFGTNTSYISLGYVLNNFSWTSFGYSYFTGYISNFRIIKGTALYTSNFTPSTSPLTNVTNTSLLLNFTNGGVIDSAGRNDLVTVGNAKISTAVTKYGSGSIYFDGTGDYLQIPDNASLFLLGMSDFTVEAWVRGNAYGGYQGLWTNRTNENVNGAVWIGFEGTAFGVFFESTGIKTNTGVMQNNIWQHVAITRRSGTFYVWVDGVNLQSSANGVNFNSGVSCLVGVQGNFNGYIDDLRITKGVAVYTSNFTPPTSQLTITNTTDLSVAPFTPPLEHPNSSSGDPNFNNVVMLAQGNQPSDEVRWLDKSPMANVAFQTNGTSTPTLSTNSIGTRSALVFDGTDDFLNLSTPISLSAANATTFFVYRRQASGDYSLSLGDKNSTNYSTALQWNDNQIYALKGYSYPKPNLGPTFVGVTKNANALYMSGLAQDCCLLTLQNSTIIDNSGKGAAFTTVGTPTVSSVSISGTNTSAWYFNGSSYVTTPNTSTFNFTTNNSTSSSNVTIECWIYLMGSGNRGIAGARANTATSGWCVYVDGNNYLRIGSAFDGEGWSDNPITGAIPNNTWIHVAIVKNNNGCTGYVNGVAGTTLSKKTGFNYQSSQPVAVGALASQGELPFNGYISNIRIVRGALYNSSFTVPTIPLATVSTLRGAVDQADYNDAWNTATDVFVNSVGTYGGYRHKGPLGEIIYANCTLPDPELQLIGNNLRTKWGIT
jgi:hypothetical protein